MDPSDTFLLSCSPTASWWMSEETISPPAAARNGKRFVAANRGGSVCLNSFMPIAKWFPALFMPRVELSAAG